MALRFHLYETDVFPKPRLLAALRILLDRRDLADIVIPDLERAKDWSVVNKVAKLFIDSDDGNRYVRVPATRYLCACPRLTAKLLLARLKKIDPKAVEVAMNFGRPTTAAK